MPEGILKRSQDGLRPFKMIRKKNGYSGDFSKESSSRFPKTFKKLNTQTVFDNIIYNLKKSKFVSK